MRTALLYLAFGLLAAACPASPAGEAVPPAEGPAPLVLTEHVGREWSRELVRFPRRFPAGAFPDGTLRVRNAAGEEVPSQLTAVETHADGSLRAATIWLVVTLPPHGELRHTLHPGAPTAAGDLALRRDGQVLEVTTSRAGARFRLGEESFDPALPAAEVAPHLAALRQRSGAWGGRGWFETPHPCSRRRVWVMEEGPVFVQVGFEFRFDGYRGAGEDVFRGHARLAAGQEVIEFVEEYALGDPEVYRIWTPESRAEAILWDWWQWRPHEAESNFCFSLYDGLQPTRARWYGHNTTEPQKRTGRNPGLDFETDYTIPYDEDRFEFSINSYHRGCPNQALSYMLWRDEDPQSDAVAVLGLRPTEWLNPDMLPHLSESIVHHTDTSDLRLYSTAAPDFILRAPLHLGRRVWGLATLQMPEAGPTRHAEKPAHVQALEEKNAKAAARRYPAPATWAPSQALFLRAKHGNRPLDKIKDWTLRWDSTKPYPRLFVKPGEDIRTVLDRIRASHALRRRARRTRHKPASRYLLEGGEANARATAERVRTWCEKHIDILFEHGYCSHRGTNNNQFPWWLQEMSAQFDLVMGMPEVDARTKEELKAYFAFCVQMLQDDDFMPPRETGVGWGSANMPINTRGGRAVTAAALSDNPDAGPWLERTLEYIDVMVPEIWAEDGSPISGPHYVNTQADPLLSMSLPLYYAGVMEPIQKRFPRLRRFARLLVDRLTPPDLRADGLRVLPTIGHTRVEACALIGKYAVLMHLTDRRLAGQMYWLWRRGGESTHGFLDGLYYMHEAMDPVTPTVTSSSYPGGLTFLRHGFPHPDETYMAIHVGDHSIDHYDNDVGAFHLYAKGVPLSVDFASMYNPNCWQSLWHNTLSWNVREHEPKMPAFPANDPRSWYHGKPWVDHEYEPHRLLDRAADSKSQRGYEKNNGQVRGRAFFKEADFLTAAMPLVEFQEHPFFNKDESPDPAPWAPYTPFDRKRLDREYEWQRRFIFVKDADLHGPNYFLIHDDLGGQDELEPLANVWCLAEEQAIDGARVHWTGRYAVDLELYVAFPKEPRISTRRWWHRERGPLRADFKDGREEQIAAHIQTDPGARGYTLLLYPRGRYEAEPSFASNPDGSAVQVRIGERQDLLFCTREARVIEYQGAAFRGTMGVVKQHPSYTALALAAGGELEAAGLALAAEMPASLRLSAEGLEGRADGAGTLRLSGLRALRDRPVELDGKEVGTVDGDGTLAVTLPEGSHRLRIAAE